MNAVDVAVRNGATVVSMSFGGNEFSSETVFDSHFKTAGVTFVASGINPVKTACFTVSALRGTAESAPSNQVCVQL